MDKGGAGGVSGQEETVHGNLSAAMTGSGGDPSASPRAVRFALPRWLRSPTIPAINPRTPKQCTSNRFPISGEGDSRFGFLHEGVSAATFCVGSNRRCSRYRRRADCKRGKRPVSSVALDGGVDAPHKNEREGKANRTKHDEGSIRRQQHVPEKERRLHETKHV